MMRSNFTVAVCPRRVTFDNIEEVPQMENRRRAAYPGSFNPLTIAHLAVIDAAHEQLGLDEIDLIVSEVALDKPAPPGPSLAERLALIESDLLDRPWARVRTTSRQLIADIASGYDAVVMGADKWRQINDVRYYAGVEDRNRAIAELPLVAIAPRDGDPTPLPDDGIVVLDVAERYRTVSSTTARTSDPAAIAPAARRWWSLRP